MSHDDCGKCEQLLQGYLDRELTAQEVTTFLGGAQSQHLCGR